MDTKLNLPPPNPFRPGAGHAPPYLAGRDAEKKRFLELLKQEVILENLILTGLRGVGKTVLLDTFKPLATNAGWLWTATDLSESVSVSEEALATRVFTDLALLTSHIIVHQKERRLIGFGDQRVKENQTLDFHTLRSFADHTPGLVADKLKAVLELAWRALASDRVKGIIIAYDEAQNLSDRAANDQYPLSLLLDVFQSIQKKGIPIMLVLTGLPTLFPKLVEARTFTERMFHVMTLKRLGEAASRDAILKPIAGHQWRFRDEQVAKIIEHSGGYPYFLQFFGREVYDSWIQQHTQGNTPTFHFTSIIQKLDNDFFAGRWSRATDRQRDLMALIASLPNCDEEFSAQDIVEKSRAIDQKPFSSSHVIQMLGKLADAGLVFKNRHGRYSFAVPLLGQFIRRQQGQS